MSQTSTDGPDREWVAFPGGELEGRRPKALCSTCRALLRRAVSARLLPRRTLCFACYRAELDRLGALKKAGQLHTSSQARFQFLLPLEPVDRARLEMLKVERIAGRAASARRDGPYPVERRRAQIAARRALQAAGAGRRTPVAGDEPARALAAATHAAELQLPESWIPFVVSR
jgi:hypothetical protein